MNNTRKAIWLLALLFLQAAGITDAADNEIGSEIAQSTLHDIMTDRISEAITQMELLLLDQTLTEKELNEERKRKAAIIAVSAAELQHSVDTILALQPQLPLNQEESPKFGALANKLKFQASELEGLARSNRFNELKPAHEVMKTTCNACHALFRGY
jgi:hypothetical protein